MSREKTIRQLLKEAWDLRRNSDYTRAKAYVDEALLLCESRDHEFLGHIYHIKMQFETDHNQIQKAIEFSKGSVAFYKKAGKSGRIAHATRHLADLQFQLGALDDAEQNYLDALKVYRDHPDNFKSDLANTLRGYGLLLERKEAFDTAMQTWHEVKEIYAELGIHEGVEEAKSKIKKLEERRV